MNVKKIRMITVAMCATFLLSGCSSGCDVTKQSKKEPPETVSGENYCFVSDFGYTMEYDPEVFFVLTDDSSDSFGLYNEDIDTTPSVGITVQRVSGYTIKEYTSYLTDRVESGVWSATEASFGADGTKATTISYDKDTDLGKVFYGVTLIKAGKDILVMETVTYEGMPEEIANDIQQMQATFKVQ